jgi:ketosteroid isomerase-like protein
MPFVVRDPQSFVAKEKSGCHVCEGNAVVIQAEMSGPIPAEVPNIAKKGQDVHIPHCYILRFDANGKITRLDAYWDNTVLNSIRASAV